VDKLSVLRACNRVLKPGGRLAFFVIAMTDDLNAEQRERALQVGHVDAGPGYPALLEQAGFENNRVTDVTDNYLATLTNWYDTWNEEAVAVRALIGLDDFSERQNRRLRTIQSVGDGVVCRYLVSARRPQTDG
jgi:cyclopropane fatty-acyl-phospholipid synthase-like methyltransferase